MEKEEFSRMILPEEQFGAIEYPLVEESGFDLERMGREINDKKILSQPISQEVGGSDAEGVNRRGSCCPFWRRWSS